MIKQDWFAVTVGTSDFGRHTRISLNAENALISLLVAVTVEFKESTAKSA